MYTQKRKRNFFSPHLDLNRGPLQPKASVLPMSTCMTCMVTVQSTHTNWPCCRVMAFFRSSPLSTEVANHWELDLKNVEQSASDFSTQNTVKSRKTKIEFSQIFEGGIIIILQLNLTMKKKSFGATATADNIQGQFNRKLNAHFFTPIKPGSIKLMQTCNLLFVKFDFYHPLQLID